MIHFPGTYKCRDANALGFIPFRRRVIRDDDWRIAGEDMNVDTTATHDAAAPSASASPEQDALRAKLHSINERNRAFWDAQPSTAGLRTAIDINAFHRQFYGIEGA